MRHLLYMNASCPTLYPPSHIQGGHIYMSHGPYLNESCPFLWMRRLPYVNESRCARSLSSSLSHTHMQGDARARATAYCETRLIPIWDMTHSYMRHDSFIYETRLIHIRDMTHSYTSRVPYMSESCSIYKWVMSHSLFPLTHTQGDYIYTRVMYHV